MMHVEVWPSTRNPGYWLWNFRGGALDTDPTGSFTSKAKAMRNARAVVRGVLGFQPQFGTSAARKDGVCIITWSRSGAADHHERGSRPC